MYLEQDGQRLLIKEGTAQVWIEPWAPILCVCV